MSSPTKIGSYATKFYLVYLDWNLDIFGLVGLPIEIRPTPTKIRLSRPRPKVLQVGVMLKFDQVGPDQNSAKFDHVGSKDTSFKKFNLNFFYKKMDSRF